jgi:hypothetical protein
MSPQIEQSAGRHTLRALCAAGAVAAIALASAGCGSTAVKVEMPDQATGAVKAAHATHSPRRPRRRVVVRRQRVKVVYTAVPSTVVRGAPSGSCGGGLYAGSRTSCPFAENVRAAYGSSGPGTVMVYSPVTRRTYAMRCTAGATVVCTGGDDAWVSFPGAYVAPAGERTSTCGGGLYAGPATSCAFAENVRSAYQSQGPGIVRAYSPVTRRTYAMSCSGVSPVVCTGGDNAYVSFG